MPRAASSTAAKKSAEAKTSPKPAKATKASKSSSSAPSGKKLSAYNKFMKEQLPLYKQKNPGVDHKQAFKEVAGQWKTSKLNPKNAVAA